jgi:hypothetical protein
MNVETGTELARSSQKRNTKMGFSLQCEVKDKQVESLCILSLKQIQKEGKCGK